MATVQSLFQSGVHGASEGSDVAAPTAATRRVRVAEVKGHDTESNSSFYTPSTIVKDVVSSAAEEGGQRVYDDRKYPFDVMRAKAAKVKFGAGQEGMMGPKAAGALMEKLIKTFVGDNPEDGDAYAFMKSLFLMQALNGSSVVQHGRAVLQFGNHEPIEYSEVQLYLGPDARRFYRAYAVDIVEVTKETIDSYDRNNADSVECVMAIRRIAGEKVMTQYPAYISDVAEYGTSNPTILAAIKLAKQDTLDSSSNPMIYRAGPTPSNDIRSKNYNTG